MGTPAQDARRVVHAHVPLPLHALPRDPGLAQATQVAGIVVGDGHVDRLRGFERALPDQVGQTFADVRDLQTVIHAQFGIEHLEVLIAVSAAGHDLLGPGLLEAGHIELGLRDRLIPVAHLVGAAAAAELLVPGDAHIETGLLQQRDGSSSDPAAGFIAPRETTGVVHHRRLVLPGVLDVQVFGPPPALSTGIHQRWSALGHALDQLVPNRHRLTVVDTLFAHRVQGLEDVELHGVLAGDIAGAAQVAVVDHLRGLGCVLDALVQQPEAEAHSTPTRVRMEVEALDAGAGVGVFLAGDLLQGDELAGRATAARLHLSPIIFQRHLVTLPLEAEFAGIEDAGRVDDGLVLPQGVD